MFYTCFVRFTVNYFTFWVLSFTFWCPFLVCKYIIDFCMFILNPTTLLNSVMCVSSFLPFFFVDSLEFSMLSIRPSVNKDSCIFSFHICVPLTFFFFFNLNALARTSSTMLIKSCETWLPYFVLSLVGEVFSFSHSSIMSFLVVQVVKNLPAK